MNLFSRRLAILYEALSARPLVRWSVGPWFLLELESVQTLCVSVHEGKGGGLYAPDDM